MNNGVIKFYLEERLNCAESMLALANEEFKLNLNSDSFKIMSGFGGGMYEEDVCGVITGGVAALSLIFPKGDLLKESVIEFKQESHQQLKSTECRDIKPILREEARGCVLTIDIAYDILRNIIIKNKKKAD